MSEELKPCPFCGGEAELDTSQAYRALSGGTLGSRAAVYCARCGADMGFCYEDAPGTPREDIVNQVVDDWNRRAPSPDMREVLPLDRETLGRMVREAWVRWALTQPAPKPSWLVPYDEMSEPDKEADRQIGEAIAKWTMLHHEARNALADPDMREAVKALILAGNDLANCAYNLSQEERLTNADRRTLRLSQVAWDDARRSLTGAKP